MTHGCMQSSHTQKVMYLLQQINVAKQIIRSVIKETLYTDRHTECVLRGIEGRGREKGEREKEGAGDREIVGHVETVGGTGDLAISHSDKIIHQSGRLFLTNP